MLKALDSSFAGADTGIGAEEDRLAGADETVALGDRGGGGESFLTGGLDGLGGGPCTVGLGAGGADGLGGDPLKPYLHVVLIWSTRERGISLHGNWNLPLILYRSTCPLALYLPNI